MAATAMREGLRALRQLCAATLLLFGPIGAAGAQEKPAEPSPPPAAQPKEQTPQQPPGWTVRCDNAGQGLACKAMQAIVLAKTRQLLLSASISRPGGSDTAALLLQLPHGLFNPAGVTVSIDDGKSELLQIQTCDAKGCYAGAPVSPEQLAAMKTAAKLNVVFQDLKKQTITVPVPLKGFEEAFKKL